MLDELFFQCCGCICIDHNKDKNIKNIKNIKNDEYKKIEKELKVLFLYNQSDRKIDTHIHQIIFYEEYLKGYYDEYSFDPNLKKILLINNNLRDIKDISTIINHIHKNNGLSIKNNETKWIPEQIWVFN